MFKAIIWYSLHITGAAEHVRQHDAGNARAAHTSIKPPPPSDGDHNPMLGLAHGQRSPDPVRRCCSAVDLLRASDSYGKSKTNNGELGTWGVCRL